jgi:hypothetical protein
LPQYEINILTSCYPHRFLLRSPQYPGIRDFYAQNANPGNAFMRVSSPQERLLWSLIAIPGAIVLLAAISTNSEARARHSTGIVRHSTVMMPATVQQQKPIKLRYYGGPKSPMYPG